MYMYNLSILTITDLYSNRRVYAHILKGSICIAINDSCSMLVLAFNYGKKLHMHTKLFFYFLTKCGPTMLRVCIDLEYN